MVAHQVAKEGFRVLILEAAGVAPDLLGRWAMGDNYTNSPSKAPDSPFCGDDVLPTDPNVNPKTDPGKYRFLQPSPIEDGGKNYYDYSADSISKKRFFRASTSASSVAPPGTGKASTSGCCRTISR